MLHSPDRGVVIAIAILLSVGPIAGTAWGQTAATGLVEDGPDSWEQEHKLLPGSAGAQFGDDVARDGEDFIVGAPVEEKVYVYKDTDEGPVRYVFPATPENATQAYGTAVDIDGDLAAVGANGIAFVFERVSEWKWEHVGTLEAPPNPDDGQRSFGLSIAVDDQTNTAIVGAFREDTDAGSNAGAAFVYSPDGGSWTLDATLTPDDPNPSDAFAEAVALEGSIALFGASKNDTAGFNTGAAYVFQGSNAGWTQTAKLLGSEASTDQRFGSAVALDGSRALIGSEDPAYVFEDIKTPTPTELARLVPNDRLTEEGVALGEPILWAAEDVGFDGDTAVIGARAQVVGQPGGQAFVFQEAKDGSWFQATELEQRDPESHASPAADNPGFGEGVAVEGNRVLVGAPFEDSVQGERDGGAVYVYSACTDDGPLSGFVHDNVEPAAGPGQEEVHDANCHWIASNGG